jgi:hypothetical protein
MILAWFLFANIIFILCTMNPTSVAGDSSIRKAKKEGCSPWQQIYIYNDKKKKKYSIGETGKTINLLDKQPLPMKNEPQLPRYP